MLYETARRYRITAPSSIPVTQRPDRESSEIARLPPGAIIVCAEISPQEEGRASRLRISAPAGWIEGDALEEAPPHPPLALGFPTFQENHERVAPGDQYRLEFPFTHELFQSMGPSFLTSAFQAAGTLSADNAVESILDYRIIDGGGASTSAAFDVAYRQPDPDLHSELFVKMPAADPNRKFISSHMLFGETQIAMRFAELSMPTPVAQFYFGDYCRATSNGILITERIGFGRPPIEEVLPKGLDHTVPDADERYAELTRLQAELVHFHKSGGLGAEAEEIFPFRAKIAGMPPVEIEPLIEFIDQVIGHLLPSNFRTPAFLSTLRKDGQEILDNLDPLSRFLGRDVDYTGFCHANLNLDNAWFFRTPTGEMRAGLIDWGSAGQMSLGQSFQGMLFATEPARFLDRRARLVKQFVKTYAEVSGVQLDGAKLLLQAKIASMTGLPLLVYATQDALGNYSVEDLRSIPDSAAPRLSTDSGLGTLLAMLGTFVSEWLDTETPADVCRQLVEGRLE